MDPCAFSNMRQQLQCASFSDDKLAMLRCSSGLFSADQVAEVVDAFGHSNDKMQALSVIEQRICYMTCASAARILQGMSFSNDQLSALTKLAPKITDKSTQSCLVTSVFKFSNDRSKAMGILNCSPQYVYIPAAVYVAPPPPQPMHQPQPAYAPPQPYVTVQPQYPPQPAYQPGMQVDMDYDAAGHAMGQAAAMSMNAAAGMAYGMYAGMNQAFGAPNPHNPYVVPRPHNPYGHH